MTFEDALDSINSIERLIEDFFELSPVDTINNPFHITNTKWCIIEMTEIQMENIWRNRHFWWNEILSSLHYITIPKVLQYHLRILRW